MMLGWLIALSVVGIVDSLWLLYVHVTGSSQGCQITSSIHCGVLKLHTYSEWIGIPVPVFSLLFYIFVFVVAFYVRKKKIQDVTRPTVYLFFLSLMSVSTSVYFASISFFVLKTLCPFCFILYLISLAFIVVTYRGMMKLNNPWGYLVRYDVKRAHRSPWIIWPAVIFVITVLVGRKVFEDKIEISTKQFEIASVEKRALGVPDARVTITTFSDFECPHCKIAGELFHALEAEMHGQVKVVYKYYPLDGSCNPSGGMHKWSCMAARASYCASLHDQFWPYHDLIYANQTSLDEQSFYQFAFSLHLDAGEFESCMKDARSLEPIQKDIEEGNHFGIQGTPTIYLNGKKYSGPATLSALKTAISEL